jgi:hypothetical protein
MEVRGRLALASLAVLLAGAASANAAESTTLDVALCAPDRNSFTLTIDNDYFPLPVDRQWVLQGREQGETIGLRVTVLNATENLYRGKRTITTRVVEEAEWVDANGNGLIDDGAANLKEISLNYYAQTQDGTVCYFGEEVDIYDGGVVSHEGAWRADTRGNAPGIFMPADPQVGMTYQQEVAPGVAEDLAEVVRHGSVTVPVGDVR